MSTRVWSLAAVGALVTACSGASGVRGTATVAPAVGPRGGAQVPSPTASAPAPRTLAWGSLRTKLEPCGEALDDGRRVDRYVLDLDGRQRVRLRMASSEVDSMLEVSGPGGFTASNDDAFPGTLHALLTFVPPAPGRYEVRATTASPGQHGNYLLVAETRPLEGEGQPLDLTRPLEGVLSEGRGQGGPPGEWYRFHAEAGSRVRLRVTSTEFDTVATVFGPRGESWVNDDGNELGADGSERPLDSTLVVAAPETGDYQLVVTSYGLRAGGRFRVATSARPPVVAAPGEATPATGYAGPDARGRVLGLYAGITAYSGHSTLYGCADDARFLGQAMRATRLQGPGDQQVLTDGAATRAAFLAGIERLAARARPEDVVLVFFSGHGNVQPVAGADPVELDGTDEVIQLYDGVLTDTEVTAALARVRAGTVILALDSCHAGGFADDFVTAPGRIGLFSSDADVLSDTAEPRRAGGYLSYHLRRAVLGEADARPHDGVLLAGELTDHVYAGFVTDHARINPPGGTSPMQRLEVRRGSVPWTQALWVYPRAPDLALPEVPSLPLESAPPAGTRSARPSCSP